MAVRPKAAVSHLSTSVLNERPNQFLNPSFGTVVSEPGLVLNWMVGDTSVNRPQYQYIHVHYCQVPLTLRDQQSRNQLRLRRVLGTRSAAPPMSILVELVPSSCAVAICAGELLPNRVC